MSAMQAFSYLRYPVAVLTNVCTGVTHLTFRILSLKENVDASYEYLRLSASHKVNPPIVPPVDLCNMPLKVKHDISTIPTLELPDDPDRNIKAYFSIMKETLAVMDDFLLVVLTIPLIYKPLQMDFYEIYNPLSLHPDFVVKFSYIV